MFHVKPFSPAPSHERPARDVSRETFPRISECLGSRDLTHGVSTESPLPLWERDRVRGLAPAGADESVAGRRTRKLNTHRPGEIFSRYRASPLILPSPARGEGALLDGLAFCRLAGAVPPRSPPGWRSRSPPA